MLKKVRPSSTQSVKIQDPQAAEAEKIILESNLNGSVALSELEEENEETSESSKRPIHELCINLEGPRILRLGPEYPPLAEQQVFIQEMLDFNALYIPKKNDLFSIQHNFTLLTRLLQTETEKPANEQRFIELSLDENTGPENRRYDFSLKVNDRLFSAYVYRYQKKIIYGLMPDGLEDPIIYHQTIPALVNLAKTDIETLTQQIQKTAPPFEIISAFKDEVLVTFLHAQFHLT